MNGDGSSLVEVSCMLSNLCREQSGTVRISRQFARIQPVNMSRRRVRGTTQSDTVDYTPQLQTDCAYLDSQFEKPPTKVPWKPIIFATVLFVAGSVSIIIGVLIGCGQIDNQYMDRLWPVLILGVIMFIPGVYHVRLACLAYRKVPGYSFDDIPEYN